MSRRWHSPRRVCVVGVPGADVLLHNRDLRCGVLGRGCLEGGGSYQSLLSVQLNSMCDCLGCMTGGQHAGSTLVSTHALHVPALWGAIKLLYSYSSGPAPVPVSSGQPRTTGVAGPPGWL
jgi:hypothetical protein